MHGSHRPDCCSEAGGEESELAEEAWNCHPLSSLAPPACATTLPSPATLNVTLVRNTQATIVWDPVPGVAAYRVLRSFYSVGPYVPVAEVRAPPGVAPSTTATVTNLVTGRIVYLRVASGDAAGAFSTQPSAITPATPMGPPTRPVVNLGVASYNENEVTVTWELPGAAADAGPLPTVFAVEYRCGAVATLALFPGEFAGVQGTVVPVGGVKLDAPCYFIVISRNLNYDTADPWAATTTPVGLNQRSSTSFAPYNFLMESPPGEVAALGASGATLTSITVEWFAAPRALLYRVLYARVLPSGVAEDAVVFSTDLAGLLSIVTGLQQGVSYEITVQARNKHTSGYTPGRSVRLSVEDFPGPPRDTFISALTASTVEVSWFPPETTQPLKFEVSYQRADGSGPFTTVEVPGGAILTVLRLEITGLATGVPVKISVRASNLYGWGSYANITASPFAEPQAAPSQADASLYLPAPFSAANLSWAAVQFATRYRVEVEEQLNPSILTYAPPITLPDEYPNTSAVVRDLTSQAAYRFTVFAGNPAGYHSAGAVTNRVVTDYVDQPSEPVLGLRAVGATASSLLFEWTQSAAQLAISEAYLVEVSSNPAFPPLQTTALPEVTKPYTNDGDETPGARRRLLADNGTLVYVNATGLAQNTRYYVRVTPRSANRLGYAGVPSATATETPVAPPTEAVANLQVVSILNGRATLRWDRITAEPNVTSYSVVAYVAGTGTVNVEREVLQPPSGLTVEFDVLGLTEGLTYDFVVTARTLNSAGYSGVPTAAVPGVSFMGLPEPPVGLRVTFLTHDSVSLAWSPAPVFPPATAYQVEYRIGRVNFSAYDIPPTPDTNYTVTGLLRGSAYEFRVRAGTLAGFESTGSVGVLATPTFRPLPARRIRIISIASGSVSFEWTAPVYPKANTYKIEFGNRTDTTRESAYTATGLEPGVPVTFTVYARNINSLGYEPTGVSATLTPIAPPGPVDSLEVTGVSTTQVFLSFDPDELANVSAYKAQYKRSQDAAWVDEQEVVCRENAQSLVAPPTCATNLSVGPLVLGVQYDIRLLTRNANQIGYQDIGTVVRAVPVFKPTRPATSLRVVGLSTSHVSLSFDFPLGIDAPTHYSAVYRPADGNASSELVSAEVTVPVNNINVSGLVLNRAYRFEVIGRNLNIDGYAGAVRSIALVAAPLEKPPRVGAVTVNSVTGSSVSLSWSAPSPDVTQYRIDIADDTALVNGQRRRLSDFGLFPQWVVAGYTNETSYTARSSGSVTLTAGLPVLVRVSARNLNTDGYGEGTTARATPIDAPPRPPQGFAVSSVTTQSIFLTWSPPAEYTPGDEIVTKYKLEGCAENCGVAGLFPPIASIGDKFYVLGGAEYEWTGQLWQLTGNSFWRIVAIVDYTILTYNVTSLEGGPLTVGANYQFRVAAGNMNSEAYGPLVSLSEYIPGPPREVVASNPKNSDIALNFVPPLEVNQTGKAAFYRVQVTNMLNGETYDYPETLTGTSYILRGFLYGTVYSIKVYSGNLNGFETAGREGLNLVTTTAQPCTKACCANPDSCNTCCGLGFSRVGGNAMTLYWTEQPNLDFLQYRVDYRVFGTQAGFTQYGVVYGNEVTVSGLNFAFSGYQFQIRGGQRAANTLDSERVAVQLVVPVLEPSRRTMDLTVVSVSTTSVSILWRRPYGGSESMQISYLVQVSTDSFASGAMANTRTYGPVVDRNNLAQVSIEADRLLTGTNYTVRVVALSPFMASFATDGLLSNVVSATPLPQPTSVTGLAATAVTDKSIVFTWAPPVGAQVTAYLLSWTPNDNSTVLSGGQTAFNLTGVTPGVIYTLRVRARNLNFQGYEAGVTATGTPQGVPLPPRSLRLTAVLTDGVDLRWDAPEGGPPPTAYAVECRCEIDPAFDVELRENSVSCLSGPASGGAPFIGVHDPLGAGSRTTRVQGVLLGRSYQFRVCAVGLSTLGIACGGYVTATPTAPIAPVTARLESVTEDSVTLSWSAAASSLIWSFLPLYSSPGNDLRCINGSVAALQAACLGDAACVGFTTDGCLKAGMPGDAALVPYTSAKSSVGTCCVGSNLAIGCTGAGAELSPKPECGCACRGVFRKEVRYLLQMSVPPAPFANVRLNGWGVEGGSDGFSLSASRVPGCDACADCSAACVTVAGLALGAVHEYRVFVRDLQVAGFSGVSSNIVSAITRGQPTAAVSDLSLVYTTASRIVVQWTGVASVDSSVTAYGLQVSLDGAAWLEEAPSLTLDEVPHLGEGVRHEASAGLLQAGTTYWLRVRARNYNSRGYAGVPGSNAVSGTPYPQIAPVAGLAATAVSACLLEACGCTCCAAFSCRGVGSVTLVWEAAVGPVTDYRIQTAPVVGGVIGEYTTALTLPPGATTADVGQLALGQEYAFKVQGGSTFILPYRDDCTIATPVGTPCPSVVRATPYTAPTTSVLASLRSTAVTEGSVTLQWEALESEPVTLYRVGYSTDLTNLTESVFAELLPAPTVEARVFGLAAGTPYFFQVTPRNLNPDGYLACPPTAPSLAASHEGDGTYRLTWVAPAWHTFITSYRVWYRPDADPAQGFALGASLSLPYTSFPLAALVTGLAPPPTAYTFLVTPDAPPCATIGPITPTPRAPVAQSFRAVRATDTSIDVAWSPPAAAGEVEAWELAAAACGAGAAAVCVEPLAYAVSAVVPPTQGTHTFAALVEGTRYSLRVTPLNDNEAPRGIPAYTAAAPVRAPSAPPRNVRVLSRDNVGGDPLGASVLLTWDPPLLAANESNATGYTVSYWEEARADCYVRRSHLGPVPCDGVSEVSTRFSTTEGLVTGLKPATAYFFKAFSANLHGLDAAGSVPAGPFVTSSMPAAVSGLTETSVSSTQVTLGWALPADPPATRLLMQVVAGSRVLLSEAVTCTPDVACPTSKVWTGLVTGRRYTFLVYTGAADDPLFMYPPNRYANVSGSYSGVASLEGGPFNVINPPASLTVSSWTASSLTLALAPPALDPLKGPLLGYTIYASVGASPLLATSAPSPLPPNATEVTLTTVGGAALQLYDGTTATEYVVRATAFNNAGEAFTEVANVRLHAAPSPVPNLREAPGAARERAVSLLWDTPATGAVGDIGFEYLLEVSDDDGASYWPAHELPLGTNAVDVTLVSRPAPRALAPGASYLVRISARNNNAAGYGAFTSLRVYTSAPPQPVASLAVLAVSSSLALVSWTPAPPPYPPPPAPTPPVQLQNFAVEASLHTTTPEFVPLGGGLAAVSGDSAVVPLATVTTALGAAGFDVSGAPTRFLLRVLPSTAAGTTLRPALLGSVLYADPPSAPPANFSLTSLGVLAGVVAFSPPPPAELALLSGYRLRVSHDGISYADAALIPPTAPDGTPTTAYALQGLAGAAGGHVWAQLLLENAGGASLAHSAAGPALQSTVAPVAANLRAHEVTVNSVRVRWDVPSAPVLTWVVAYAPVGGGAGTSGSLETGPNAHEQNVTGLPTGVPYTFTVSAVTLLGEGAAAEVVATPAGAPAAPQALTVLSESGGVGSVTLGWQGVLGEGVAYWVTSAFLDSDSVPGAPRTITDGAAAPSAVVAGLVAGKRYLLSVRARSLHVSGYGPAASLQYLAFGGLPAAPTVALASVSTTYAILKLAPPPSPPTLLRYRTVSTPTGGGTALLHYAAPTTIMLQVGGLTAGTEYSIQASACSASGCNPAAALVGVRTAPNPPREYRATGVAGTTISMGWNFPLPSLAYTYRLQYRTVGVSIIATFVTSDGRMIVAGDPSAVSLVYGPWSAYQQADGGGLGTTATITGLTKNTAYQISAESQINGVYSQRVLYIVRPTDPPGSIDSSFFQVAGDAQQGITNSSITVQWNLPGGSEVTTYKVSYWDPATPGDVTEVVVGFRERNTLNDGTGTNYLTIPNLSLYVTYKLRVQTRNLNVAGYDVGVMMRSPTPNGVDPAPVVQPGRVQSLVVTDTTDQSVTLAWAAPPSPDAKFTQNLRYRVRYQPVTVAPDGTVTPAGNESVTATVATLSDVVGALTLGKTYQFTVQARNNNALGFEAGSRIISGPQNPCPSGTCAVRNLRVGSYSGSATTFNASITLLWDPPLDNYTLFKYFYKVEHIGATTTLVTVEFFDISDTSLRITQVGFPLTSVGLNTAYTFRVTARNGNRAGYGPASTITVTPREQPAALVAAPTVLSATLTSVTLSWPAKSPPEDHAYKIAYRAAGSGGAWLGLAESGGGVVVNGVAGQATVVGVVGGLANGALYELKVFTRNFNEKGYEGFGSPAVVSGPRPPPGAVVSASFDQATVNSVTLVWQPPEGATPQTIYELLVGNAPSDPSNVTEIRLTNTYTRTVAGLNEGQLYYLTLRAYDLGGQSAAVQLVARPFAPAPGPTGVLARTISTGSALITWGPPSSPTTGPISAGLTVSGYRVEVRVPLGSASGTWTTLGETDDATRFFVHDSVGATKVTLFYAVRALVTQDSAFGAAFAVGAQALAQVYFGTPPQWGDAITPPDGAVLVVPRGGVLTLQLHATASDPLSHPLALRTTQALPPTAAWGPAVTNASAQGVQAWQNLTLAYADDLAGSRYAVCVAATDANGLETPTRCYTLAMPRPAPALVAPPDGATFTARVGCALALHVTAEDPTSEGLPLAHALEHGFQTAVAVLSVGVRSQYEQVDGLPLPAGAALVPYGAQPANPATFALEWQPAKGQEGFVHSICFVPSGAREGDPPVCVHIDVLRCQFCAQGGDTLQSMAKLWRTTWTEVWSGNHALFDPDLVSIEQVLTLGPVYVVREGDDLDHIAERFGVALPDAIEWNPDLQTEAARAQSYKLVDMQELCIIPQTCVYQAKIGSEPSPDT